MLKQIFFVFFSITSIFFTTNVSSFPSSASKAVTSNVGNLKGNFQVTPTGQAHYSIPIDVPPGTAGMAPALSIVYDSTSSNTKNGLLGMGFSLEGLTAITRCPCNEIQNGYIERIKFNKRDRFCLNGEQLVINSGRYGADGTEYRTYIDSKTKIISYGNQEYGPTSFKAWTKGGQVAEYAFTSDSQIKAQGKDAVAVWSLNKIQDTAGNYLEVHYFKDEKKGSFYPIEINYTGNKKANVNPYNTVKFIYEERSDVKTTYQAGSKATLDKRLKAIQVYQSSTLVYEYKLVYEISKNTFRSRITSIQKCTGNGVCLPPTKFEWQENEEGWIEAPNFILPELLFDSGNPHGQLVDLNGDGLLDLVISNATNKRSWLNTGSGWVLADSNFNLPDELYRDGKPNGQFVDLNGDGLPDFVRHDGAIGAWLNTGGGWECNSNFNPPSLITYNGKDLGSRFIDLDGDGLPDFVRNDTDCYIVTFSNTGRGLKRDYGSDWIITANDEIDVDSMYVDLKGDGLPKFVGHRSYTLRKWEHNSNFNPQSIISSNRKDFGSRFVDLNGDGLPDFVRNDADKDVVAFLNTGRGWECSSNLNPPCAITANGGIDTGSRFVDLNGDGVPDVVRHDGVIGAWLNTEGGWKHNPNFNPPFIIASNGKHYGQFVDLNGDGLPDFIVSTSNNGEVNKNAWLNKAKKLPDYLIAVTDGLGERLSIDYEPLSGKAVNVYTKEHDAKYPNMDWQGPMYVVYQTSSNTATNDPKAAASTNALNHVTTYHYSGAKFNHLGLGFLGFHNVTKTDNATGINTTTTYSQDIKLHNKGMPVASETRLANGTLISRARNFWELKAFGDSRLFVDDDVNFTYYSPYIKTSMKKNFDLNGILLSTTTINNIIDDYGNPTKIVSEIHETKTNKVYTTITDNIYRNNPEEWLIGELVKAKVTKKLAGKRDQTRTSSFSYDPETSLLVQTIAEPDDPKLSLTTKYERDLFGNIVTTTVSGEGIENRVSKVKYDNYGRFIISSTNALNQSASQITDPRFGVIVETTDSNGLKTFYQYDDFGKQVLQVAPDGTKTTIDYDWANFSSISSDEIQKALKNVSYVTTIYTDNSVTQKECYDVLNRKVATTTQNMDGKTIWQLTYYDELGRVAKTSKPFFIGDRVYWTSIQYDVLGKMTKSILSDGNLTQMIHDGFTTAIINQAQQKRVKEVNAIGELVKTIDNLGSVTRYEYDSYGNMISTKDSAGNISIIKYDDIGRKIAINDHDKGTWSYTYDVLGNLISQVDASGNITTFKYDKLNRMISRTDKAGVSTWEYDTAQNGIGKLAKVNSLNLAGKGVKEKIEAPTRAIHDGLEVYTKNYSYDSLGRTSQVKTEIRDQVYINSYSYDKNSRLDIETYPNGLKVKNNYNALGYLVEINDDQNKKVYWKLNAKDAPGHIISESHGNGLITNYVYEPKTGFLISIETISDINLKIQEKLIPDSTAKTISKTSTDNNDEYSCDVQYNNADSDCKLNKSVQKEIYYYDDTIGNITVHQDIVNEVTENFNYDELNRVIRIESSGRKDQILRYDALGNITYKSDVGTYKYGENGAGPHAVTSIKGKQQGVFEYDANGDQIKGTLNGIERTITYTSYSKPLTIRTPKAEVSFYYNADREKLARIDKTVDKTATTYYLGNYELVTIDKNNTTVTQQKAYIGPNTIYIKTEDSSNSKNNKIEIYEMLRNNLGSVTDITDESGNVIQHFSYTAFGEQKQTKGAVPFHPVTYKGFTGHEGIDVEGINLIHMGGRIYDPVIGRFLSADPYIQDLANSQSLNRYSYCINNPLALVDPSGFGFWGSLWRSIASNPVIRIVIGVAVAVGITVASFFCPALAPAAGVSWKLALGAGAIGGAVTAGLGLATGNNLWQSLLEGAEAFLIGTAISHSIQAEMYALQAVEGISPFFIPGKSKKDDGNRVPQSPDSPDQTLHNSTENALPENNYNVQNTIPSMMSDRSGGNYGNGAGTSAYREMFGSIDTTTGKCGIKSYKFGALQIDGYHTETLYKGNSNIEKIFDINNNKPLSIINKGKFFDTSYSMDGSVTHGTSMLSFGTDANGRGIADISVPIGSRSSVGMTCYFDPGVFSNNIKHIGNMLGQVLAKPVQGLPIPGIPAPVAPVFP